MRGRNSKGKEEVNSETGRPDSIKKEKGGMKERQAKNDKESGGLSRVCLTRITIAINPGYDIDNRTAKYQ